MREGGYLLPVTPLILPDARPENFMAQKYCVTIPMQLFEVLFWRRFFQVTWEVLSSIACLGVL